MEIAARTCHLKTVGDFIRENAKTAGFSENEARSIELAVDELVSNAIIHGYRYNSGGKILIEAVVIAGGMMIILEEMGEKFDPSKIEDPDLEAPLKGRKMGGLGLFLVKRIMDEIYYESDANKVKRFTLIKRI